MAEERMLITGGQRLEGTVRVSGGKNTAVAIIPAAILSHTPCVIENLPSIEDVHVSVETLQHLGAKVTFDPKQGIMEVDSSTINRTDVPLKKRASCGTAPAAHPCGGWCWNQPP